MILRLKHIVQDVDFRKNELTTYEAWHVSKNFTDDPKLGEAIMFVSKSGNQLLWVLHYNPESLVLKTNRRSIESLKFRVSGGYWNPMLLANYAAEVGIELEGIKRFEESFNELRS